MAKKAKKKQTQTTPYDITPPAPIILVELSMADKFYIEQNKKTYNPSKLAQDIGKPIELIKEYILSLTDQKQADRYMDIVSSGEKAKGYIRNDKGATIMTEVASEIADAQKLVGTKKNLSDRIHKMK